MPVQERTRDAKAIPYEMWMAGLREGSFFVNIFKSSHHKVGYQVRQEFELAQHIRDELLMASFTSLTVES